MMISVRTILEGGGWGGRGVTLAKVSILIGGPDWATAVLTGILELNVFAMLLGTLPVVLLVVRNEIK
jgi:hypothetical protein